MICFEAGQSSHAVPCKRPIWSVLVRVREEMGQPLVNYIKIASDKCKGQCGQTRFSCSKVGSSPSEDITVYC